MSHPSIRRFGAGIAAAIALAGVGRTGLAADDAERVALIWNAPPGCPTSSAIHDAVERALAVSLKEVAPVAAAVGVAEISAGRWRADLVVHSHGKRAERRFEAESCQAVG